MNRANNTIYSFFQVQTTKMPNYIAIRFKNEEITYKDLSDKVNCLSRVLKSIGLTRNSIVGIMVNRGIEMLIGILAILKVGGAYLPVDPDYPDERINYMLEDSNTKTILTQRIFSEKIKYSCEKILFDDTIIDSEIDNNIEDNSNPDDLAYVIYTSGSTGKPKGVMIEHKSVINFFNGVVNLIDFTEGKKILALTTISFDIFVLETLLALTRGLTIVLADENEQRNPKLLSELIINNDIEMLQMTPSRMQLLVNHDRDLKCLRNLKEIMIGGETFPQVLFENIKKYTNAKIYNMYGPTETTVWSTVSDLTMKNSIDIGKPITNTQIYIVDENNNIVPKGFEGELCIGGAGLARGYLKRPKLTADKFISNPFVPGERIYKTGDLARWLPDGNIEYLGRMDNQVKIRGYRVELGEIESHLLKYKSIKQAVVTANNGKENVAYLCAFFTTDEEMEISDLRNYLSESLPDYMVPSYFIRLDSLPQTPNGKVDRNNLPNPETLLGIERDQEVIGCKRNSDPTSTTAQYKFIWTRTTRCLIIVLRVWRQTDALRT
jgi:amino acid adenylation domain-containing protein